jgi:NCAIR mutase (PurE)-related protein
MIPDSEQLQDILQAFISDSDQREQAAARITQAWHTDTVEGALLDLGRHARCGFPEVIYGEGKSLKLITEILQRQIAAGQAGLVTRVAPEFAPELLKTFPQGIHQPEARTFRIQNDDTSSAQTNPETENVQVVVVTAGSTDGPVAREAVETLRWMGVSVELIEDVGVAGPQRLLQNVSKLRGLAAVVVVAGMEAALPSVVGGHVDCPVIGVPTSVGYGASLGGITALLSMLTCCASNVVTVNIDAGFRGGYIAGVIARGRNNRSSV